MKIEKLTPEQEARLPEFFQKWLKIGLSVDPTNKEAAQNAVIDAYRVAGKAAPQAFIWLESPLRGAVGAAILAQVRAQVRDQVRDQVGAQVWDQVRAQVGDQVWNQVWDQVRDQVWDQVRDQVRDQVGAQVWDQVRAQVWNQVWDQVRDQVWDQVWNQVWDQVRAQVRDQVGNQVGNQIYRCGYGLHDANWLGFYNYFLEVCNLESCKALIPLSQLSQYAGWWWPFEHAVILTEKPIFLSRNENHRLHADGRLAIEYSDGWGVYAFDGVRLPEKYGAVKQSDWQSKWLIEEKNAELRMVLIKGIGYERMFHELEAKKLDSWREYELLRIENVDVEPVHLLKMVCPSTQKIHIGRVPPDCLFAREAATLRNKGVDPEEFVVEH